MTANYFWLFVVLLIIGLLLMLLGGKKQAGAKDFPASVQWGALCLVIGAFGVLSEYMSFTAAMLLFVVVTGGVAALDRWVRKPLCHKRASTPNPNAFIDYSRGFFPVILAVFILRSFIVEPFTIPSSSMRPGLTVGDFILVNKFAYGIRLPVLNNVLIPVGKVQRGDVVVFNFPPNPKVNFIKRVIGLPGDTVAYRNKHLTINGQVIPETNDGNYSYQEPEIGLIYNNRYRENFSGKLHDILNIPNTPALDLSNVKDFAGRDQCRYDDTGFVCKVPAGHYFMMGDNRDNSLDSRYWGFVDDRLMVGKAFFVWMNFGQPKRIGSIIH